MKRTIYLATFVFAITPALTQSIQTEKNTPIESEAPAPAIASTSRLVVVPALVQTHSGKFVTNLRAQDFRLSDNGIEQKIIAEQIGREPLAIVVLMQTGGAAPRQFQDYRTFNTLLNALLTSTADSTPGSAPNLNISRSAHEVALVTFDSRVQEIWNFPPRIDGIKHAFANPEGGDNGAAILDALNCGIGLLQYQPASFRRILLLLSQFTDVGSQTPAADVVRRLAGSNTTVYSISFNSKSLSRNDAGPKSAQKYARYPKSAERAFTTATPQPTLQAVEQAMRENTAAEAAALSGGANIGLRDSQAMLSALSILTTDFANSYQLSFHPIPGPAWTSGETGFHTIQVEIPSRRAHLEVTARASYWFDPAETGN